MSFKRGSTVCLNRVLVGHVANSRGMFWCSKQESYSPAGTLQIHGWTERLASIHCDYNIWLSFCDYLSVHIPLSFFLSSPWLYYNFLLYTYLPPKTSSSQSHSCIFLAVFSYTSLPPLYLIPSYSFQPSFTSLLLPPSLSSPPLHTLNFGESASAGTGMMMSTLLAVERFLNWPFAWRKEGGESERGGGM